MGSAGEEKEKAEVNLLLLSRLFSVTKVSSLCLPPQLQRVRVRPVGGGGVRSHKQDKDTSTAAPGLSRPGAAGIGHQAEGELEAWSRGRAHAGGLVVTRPCGVAFLSGKRAQAKQTRCLQ